MLVNEGNQVDIACNYNDLELDKHYSELGCNVYQIDFSRSPLSASNIKAYGQLNDVIVNGNYDIVHCHTPNASVITRLVCRKFRKRKELKVFYTAHGFHFYKGASILNWMLFYPIEKMCARFTDKLITINEEDYNLAKKHFKCKRIYYIPGVGIDFSKYEGKKVDKNAKKREIGVPEDTLMLLSVGELNDNKNHQVVIKALAELDNNVHYVIAGEGNKRQYLIELAEKLGVSKQIHLIGYRTDIPELNHTADIFCFPSIREGLGLAAIEAMICGTPVVALENRGTRSFIRNGLNGILCRESSKEAFLEAIRSIIEDNILRERMIMEGRISVLDYSEENVLKQLRKLYQAN